MSQQLLNKPATTQMNEQAINKYPVTPLASEPCLSPSRPVPGADDAPAPSSRIALSPPSVGSRPPGTSLLLAGSALRSGGPDVRATVRSTLGSPISTATPVADTTLASGRHRVVF